MSADIGPGTPLICVDNSPGAVYGEDVNLTVGAMYFCSRVHFYRQDRCYRDNCGNWITLRDRGRGSLNGFCPGRFRPLNDGDTSLVEEQNAKDLDAAIEIVRKIQEREPA